MNDAWLILFLPLFAAIVITLFTQRWQGLSAGISVLAIVTCFFLTVAKLAGFQLGDHVVHELSVPWLTVANLNISFGLRFDQLSLMMLLIVTGVGSLIHIYSIGYMHGDRSYSRFFACMSLFTFSMTGIVLSNNLFQMFIFWELVGVSSYLLIGFWYQKPSAADAAKKAFLTNRLGDFGFFTGIILVWVIAHTLNFAAIKEAIAANPALFGTGATAVGLLIFCGAVGKSAQFPLHVWLPDAMEGPTPVSALIHAATMVAAGVYMLCRVFYIFDASALQVISWIGGITALMAALMAVQQNDIKRILAYSTLSQLGYMVMAVGLTGPTAAMFHLSTHAFFKALLFLGAGSVIHALSGEQDIWKMGSLKEKIPTTFWTFLAGTLALCGLWPLSGFFSKDGILGVAFDHNKALFAIAVLVAFLTTFYMFRLFFVVFLGNSKSDLPKHAHESPPVMTIPLRILAIASVAGGFFGIAQFVGSQLNPSVEAEPVFAPLAPFIHAPVGAIAGLLALAVGFFIAMSLYARAKSDPLPAMLGAPARWMRDKFYFDELYAEIIKYTQDLLARVADAFDRWVIAGFVVRGTHGTTEFFGRALRLVQTGNLQNYAFLLALGVAVVLFFVFVH
ncbi:MAG: NADH-quinone oxidoreductase subunit L [Limisphaerales bacterium]